MTKRLTDEQKKEIRHFENTFPDSVLMTPKEMAILNSPNKFPSTNKPRHYKMLSDRTEEIFKELTFLLGHLHPSYKLKILANDNFGNFMETILYLNVLTENLDEKTKNMNNKVATQLFFDSLAVIKNSLPQEFEKPFIDSAKPFLEWLKAISDYGQKNSLKDIPQIHMPNKLMSWVG